MPYVTLRHTKTGKPIVVDSDSVDVAAAVASGQFARVAAGNPSLTAQPRQVDPNLDPRSPVNAPLSNKATSADIGRHFVREALPSIAAGAATLAMPEVSVPARAAFGLARPLLNAGLRTAAAGVAGGVADLGAQGLTGERIDPQAALSRGVGEAAAQGIGEPLGALSEALGHSSYRNVFKTTRGEEKSAVKTASRIAGQPVQPDVASIAKQAEREKIALGPGPGGNSLERMDALRAPSNAQLEDALQAADITGHRTMIGAGGSPEIPDAIAALKDEVRNERGGATKVAQIDKWRDELIAQFKEEVKDRRGKVVPGKYRRRELTPRELQDQKLTWQAQADNYWKNTGDKPDETLALQARFDAAIARGAARRLENIAAPSHIPGRTLGDLIAEANSRLSSLHSMDEPLQNMELDIARGGNRTPLPNWAHAAMPAAGAVTGAAIHGPEGAAAGAATGLVADRLFNNPAFASRAGLALQDPKMLKAMQQTPRAMMLINRLFSQPARPVATSPAQPEATKQGGY